MDTLSFSYIPSYVYAHVSVLQILMKIMSHFQPPRQENTIWELILIIINALYFFIPSEHIRRYFVI